MRAFELKNEPYEPKKLEAIYQNLLAKHTEGRAQDYEVIIDGFTAIARNNDPERFLTFSDFISPETNYISVLLYRPNLNSSDKYFFHLKPNQYFQEEQLKGIPNSTKPESEIDRKEKLRKELHYDELLLENEELKKEIKTMEAINYGMEDKMDEIRSNRDLTFEVAGAALFKGIMNLPIVKENIPFASDLAGTNKEAEKKDNSTFRRKGQEPEDVQSEERNTTGLTKEEKAYIQFIDDLRRRIGDVELGNVLRLLDMVSTSTEAIHFALRQVTNYLKQRPNQNSHE